MAAIYTGTRLARLLEQRWEGHWKTTMVILENYDANVNLLERCRDCELSGEIAIEATFVSQDYGGATTLRTTLTILEPANKSLQSKTMDLLTASEVVDIILQSIQSLRDETKFNELFSLINITEEAPLPRKRQITLSNHLRNSIVVEQLPVYSRSEPLQMLFPSLYNEVIDRIISEIQSRFSAGNITLLKSLKALVSFDGQKYMSCEELGYLAKFSGVELNQANGEISTAKTFLPKKLPENS